MRPARTEFCHLFANSRKSTPPWRPAKSPRHVTQVVGRRPVACRKSPAAQTPSGPPRHNLRTRTWVAARNHRRITAPPTRTFNHGTALATTATPAAPSPTRRRVSSCVCRRRGPGTGTPLPSLVRTSPVRLSTPTSCWTVSSAPSLSRTRTRSPPPDLLRRQHPHATPAVPAVGRVVRRPDRVVVPEDDSVHRGVAGPHPVIVAGVVHP